MPRWMPTPVGPRPAPRPRPSPSPSPVAPAGGGGGGNGGPSAGGRQLRQGTGGGGDVKNPWQAAMWDNYNQAKKRPYGNEWKQGVAQAMALGNRDYEAALRGFAQEDVLKQQTAADNQLGSLGMRELALRGDVQDTRAKQRTDASTRAMIESQGIKSNALETMRAMLGSATGAELDRIGQMIQAASAGGGNYNDFMSMLIPLMEKMGLSSRGGGGMRI